MCLSVPVKTRRQLSRIKFLFLLCRSQGLNSLHLHWWQVLLPVKPSLHPGPWPPFITSYVSCQHFQAAYWLWFSWKGMWNFTAEVRGIVTLDLSTFHRQQCEDHCSSGQCRMQFTWRYVAIHLYMCDHLWVLPFLWKVLLRTARRRDDLAKMWSDKVRGIQLTVGTCVYPHFPKKDLPFLSLSIILFRTGGCFGGNPGSQNSQHLSNHSLHVLVFLCSCWVVQKLRPGTHIPLPLYAGFSGSLKSVVNQFLLQQSSYIFLLW